MDCSEAESQAEIEEIQALRYRIFVEEMGQSPRFADPILRRIAEPLDEGAIHVGAYQDDETGRRVLVGALRVHVPGRGPLVHLADRHPGVVSDRAARTGVVSRLVTDPSVRGGVTGAGFHLSIAAYRIALRERLETVEIDCVDDRVAFFEWLGFDVFHRFEHPTLGGAALMRIHPFDRATLARKRSPLVEVYDEIDLRSAAS